MESSRTCTVFLTFGAADDIELDLLECDVAAWELVVEPVICTQSTRAKTTATVYLTEQVALVFCENMVRRELQV
jgi:hypothetical protein